MRRYALLFILCCVALGVAAAERPQAGWRTSLSLTPAYLGRADVDQGGSYESRVLAVNLGAVRAVGPGATAGVTLNYTYYDNRFGEPNVFGVATPWGDVERVGFSVPVFVRRENGWSYLVTPAVDYFREHGADWGESLTYGAVTVASRMLGPKRSLGLGLGLFRQLEETRAFPFVAVDWQFTDRLRLNNPLPAGPTGPAGLELNYRASPRWEVGLGAAYWRVRFRLRSDGPFPDGIGEESGVLTFLHAATRFGENLSVDLYGGALLRGELQVEDSDGDRIAESDFDTAPFAGLALRIRF